HDDDEKEIRRLLAEGDEKNDREIALVRARVRAKARELQQKRETAAARKAAVVVKEEMMKVRPGHITVEDGDQRALAFLEKELRTIVAALRQLAVSAVLGQEQDHHIDPIKDQLAHLRDLADRIQGILNAGRAPRRAAELPELNLAWIEQLLLADGFAGGHTHTVGGSDMRMTVLPSKHNDNHPELLLQPEPEPGCKGNPHLIGIDGPSKKLLRWLVSAANGEQDENSTLRVISIVGPAGVGKTTLAMELYRRTGEQHFQCHAVARMSRQPPDTGKLLKHIMSQIIDSAAPETPKCSETIAALEGDEHELAYDLKKFLEDKRYLILIDDLWRETDWEIIQDAFPHNKCGSRILITTRVRSIARSCSSDKDGHPNSRKRWGRDGLLHEVKPLGELDSERLFSRVAFGSGGSCPSDHFRQASDEILRRCAGIPLFIIVVAGFISTSTRQNQADGLDKTATCWLEQIPELILAEEALSPSFDDLPNELKLLSLYMSTLPRGYIIDRHRLIRKWGAEGLIAPDMWTAPDEMAEEHFSKLLDRGIIRPMDRGYASEVVDCYQVDHFMHLFLASVSAHKNLAMMSQTINFKALAAAEGDNEAWKLQRLSLHHPDPELPLMLERMDFSHTRSLKVSGVANRIPFNKFVHLVVLDLEGWEKLDNDDLVEICSSKFFLLKYLSVRNTRVSKLPQQIAKLECLETLDISHTQISELPFEVLELPELRALDLRSTQVRCLSRYETSRLPGLRHLLINGDTPDETVTAVAEDIVDWRFLETLETVDLNKCSTSFIQELAKLRFLEVLAVTWSFRQCYDEEYQRALRLAIQRSVCLKSLTIHCEVGCSMEFLDSLPDAPQSLQHLRITARFLTVPKWIEGLNHLVFLDIIVCKLAPHDINLLGSLESLERLVLYLDFLPEEVISIGHEGFHQLQRLSVHCRVPWLDFSIGAMPRLTDLDLILSTGPVGKESKPSGISNLLGLEQVTLRYDPWYINSRSVKATLGTMRSQIADLGHTIKLVNNGVEEDVGTILAEMCNKQLCFQ
ncbi:hypothetical protein SORBI_3005G182100, partial [Sorghum bicolor]